jgi:hypothetical protein
MCPFSSVPATTTNSGHPERPDQNGLLFKLAATLDDVIDAWELVYQSYRSKGLIGPNAQGIHLVPEAIQPNTAVVVGRIHGLVVSTMTIYPDGERGLPLQRVYKEKLDALRLGGRELVEVGLFADRREKIERSVFALMELMRQTFFYALHRGASDILIGVHPHHAGFYKRCFAFEVFAETAGCPAVNGSPMVPLRLAIPETYYQDKLPRGLAMFKADPLDAEAFRDRVPLTADRVAGSRIDDFLNWRADKIAV